LEEWEINNKRALTKAPISAAAERMRRHRARSRQGLRLVQVQLRDTEVAALIESGRLEERSRNDPYAIAPPAVTKGAAAALLLFLAAAQVRAHPHRLHFLQIW
jgi:hypothetical protein